MRPISGRIYWCIMDHDSWELCMLCASRDEARELARGAGVVVRVERVR